MSKKAVEISPSDLMALQEMMNQLEIIYSQEIGTIPPDNYAIGLCYALWKNDPGMLMAVLDTQDINPWDINFVEDGLSSDSPDLQSMVEFASRKKSWKCVAILIQHYFDCRQQNAMSVEVLPMLSEYEAATDLERIAFLEDKIRAFNKGCTAYFSEMNGVDFVFTPTHSTQLPKSARFIFEDFSKFKFGAKKKGSPIESKRLDLHQKVFAAISVGDAKALGAALDILKVNAVAFQAAKRAAHDALTTAEINQFIRAALSCNYPECVVMIVSKALAFKKAESWVSATRKKIDEEYLKTLANEDAIEQLVWLSNIAKDIDEHQSAAQMTPATQIEDAMEKELSELLIKVHDVAYIDRLKSDCVANLTVMKDCVNRACERAASQIEKMEIDSSMPVNSETVGMPRERVRL